MIDPQDRLYRDSVLVRFEGWQAQPNGDLYFLGRISGHPVYREYDLLLRADGLNQNRLRKCQGL